MKRSLTAAVAALTFGGAVAAAALPAQAQSYGTNGYYGNDGYYGNTYHHHHRNTGGVAVAGIVGLALGAALASSSRNSYSRGGYASNSYYGQGSNSYYGNGYSNGYGSNYGNSRYGDDDDGYGYSNGYSRGSSRGYQTCQTSRWVYDPYIGRQVQVRSTYAC